MTKLRIFQKLLSGFYLNLENFDCSFILKQEEEKYLILPT